jgi:hypothetical protein
MPAALVRRAVPVALPLVSAAHPARAQDTAGERIRKTDLVRLLSDPTRATSELAARIRRTCLQFTPTVCDRADFVAVGADSRCCARSPRAPGVPPRPA